MSEREENMAIPWDNDPKNPWKPVKGCAGLWWKHEGVTRFSYDNHNIAWVPGLVSEDVFMTGKRIGATEAKYDIKRALGL